MAGEPSSSHQSRRRPEPPATLDRTGGVFVEGLARQIGVGADRLAGAGTTVVSTDSRNGFDGFVGYRLHRHVVLWADPAVVDRLPSVPDDRPLSTAEIDRIATAAGFERSIGATMRLLPDGTAPLGSAPDRHSDPGSGRFDELVLELPAADAPGLVDRVRGLTARCDPGEVEEADLDDLDNFDEAAIAIVASGSGGPVAAYASACTWDWDPVLGDIGVLVDDRFRHRGLGRLVVARCSAGLLADGRIPLYRHDRANTGSARLAESLGFRPVTQLDLYRTATTGPPDPDRDA